MKKDNGRIVEWHYAKDADLTIGEVHVSKAARIILISLIALLVIATGFGIYFRKYIYDYIVNPSVILTTNEVTLEVFSDFDPNSYVKNEKYLKDVQSTVDMKELGDYEVTYISENRVNTNESKLIVHVVDTTPPEITLANEGVWVLVRGSEEIQKFNPEDYIVGNIDNYDKNPKLEYTIPTQESFEKQKSVQIIYSSTDSSGNLTTATLSILIEEDYAELIRQLEEQSQNDDEIARLQKELEEQQKKIDEQNQEIEKQKKELEEKQNQPTTTPTPTQKPSGGNSDPTKSSDPTNPPSETTPKPTNPPSEGIYHKVSNYSIPYIEGEAPSDTLARVLDHSLDSCDWNCGNRIQAKFEKTTDPTYKPGTQVTIRYTCQGGDWSGTAICTIV